MHEIQLSIKQLFIVFTSKECYDILQVNIDISFQDTLNCFNILGEKEKCIRYSEKQDHKTMFQMIYELNYNNLRLYLHKSAIHRFGHNKLREVFYNLHT